MLDYLDLETGYYKMRILVVLIVDIKILNVILCITLLSSSSEC